MKKFSKMKKIKLFKKKIRNNKKKHRNKFFHLKIKKVNQYKSKKKIHKYWIINAIKIIQINLKYNLINIKNF